MNDEELADLDLILRALRVAYARLFAREHYSSAAKMARALDLLRSIDRQEKMEMTKRDAKNLATEAELATGLRADVETHNDGANDYLAVDLYAGGTYIATLTSSEDLAIFLMQRKGKHTR